MLEDLLSKLGASTRITVGVSISPGIGLEMIEVDRLSQSVTKYSNRPLEYDYSAREISNYEQFETALEELFEELDIPKRSNIIISIPNVYFGIINLPILLGDDAVTNAIISEVEQSYIFKRQEPVVGWCDLMSSNDPENRNLAYTAIQKGALDNIIQACDNVGCKVTGIENSYASLLKTLSFSDIAKEQIKDNVTWNLMVVGQNNYSILSMSGKKIIEYYEEPLALKSFVNDEIYNAIATSAQLTLSGLIANYLFIVSETDLVSAEVLSMRINSDSTIKFLECNKFTQNEIILVNLNILPKLSLVITPEAIGAGIYTFSDYPLKLNMIKELDGESKLDEEFLGTPKINVGNLEIELTSAFLQRIALIICGIVILPVFILTIFLHQVIIPKEQQNLNDINSKIEETNNSISKYKEEERNNTFDIGNAIDSVVRQNKTKLAYYNALGMSIPSKLWVTYYALNEAGKVDIKGKANTVENVYTFYKNLKQLINNSDVRLNKLEIASDSIDDVISATSTPKSYDFEVTNMSDGDLNSLMTQQQSQSGTQGDQNNPQTQNNGSNNPSQTNNPLFQFGQSLFGNKNNAQPPVNSDKSATPPVPPPSMQPPMAQGQLPNNLQKIEKF